MNVRELKVLLDNFSDEDTVKIEHDLWRTISNTESDIDIVFYNGVDVILRGE